MSKWRACGIVFVIAVTSVALFSKGDLSGFVWPVIISAVGLAVGISREDDQREGKFK